MIEAYKLLKDIAKLDYSLFFKLSGDSKVRGHTFKIVKNSFRLDVRKNFFSNRVVDAWNELPQYIFRRKRICAYTAISMFVTIVRR